LQNLENALQEKDVAKEMEKIVDGLEKKFLKNAF